MKIKIEDYRGFEIEFDTDKESFISVSSEHDRQALKKSYAACKKDIDDYIKANVNFKPVWVECESTYSREMKRIKIIGIRKDGRFVYEHKDGNRPLSEYESKNYYSYNEKNQILYAEISKLNKQIEEIRAKQSKISDKIVKEDLGLKELAAKYTI